MSVVLVNVLPIVWVAKDEGTEKFNVGGSEYCVL